MSQWLRLATKNSAAPVNVTQLETSIYWLLKARKAKSVSELEPKYLDIAVGSNASEYLRLCMGERHLSTRCHFNGVVDWKHVNPQFRKCPCSRFFKISE